MSASPDHIPQTDSSFAGLSAYFRPDGHGQTAWPGCNWRGPRYCARCGRCGYAPT